MRILLDTHILLWALENNPKLPERAYQLISDETNELFFSTASVWEITIKHLAKPDKMLISGEDLAHLCEQAGYNALPILNQHVFQLNTLKRPENAPPHHDPFDRMMIAQAKAEKIIFMTHDALLPDYSENCILYV